MRIMLAADIILLACAAYLACGLLVAADFIVRRLERVDPAARSSSWRFRLVILPGLVLLWPVTPTWRARTNLGADRE